MKRLTLLILLGLLTGGCALTAGYAGKHPGYITCKGKGVITITGAVAAMGGAIDTATVNADCGDGFTYSQGAPPPPPLGGAAAPAVPK